MNPSIEKLSAIASKPVKQIIGLMSGTSLDGLDIALCEITENGMLTTLSVNAFTTFSYPTDIKGELQEITSKEEVPLEKVCQMNAQLGNLHGEWILQSLEDWDTAPSEIECIASHGQTIYHSPQPKSENKTLHSTLQIGDADHIAVKTGIITISDFRQKHTAHGGEGAPLAGYAEQLLFADDKEERILLNIGGIANFTLLSADSNQPPITTDTGPGNTLIDKATQMHFSQPYDDNGSIAENAEVNNRALEVLKKDPFFDLPIPKSTGPEYFNLEWAFRLLKNAEITISSNDLVATLTRLTAETIAESISKVVTEQKQATIYVSGGGLKNTTLINWLDELLPKCELKSFSEIGFDPDAKEAALFAVLANEMLSGRGFLMDGQSAKRVQFGKISFPD